MTSLSESYTLLALSAAAGIFIVGILLIYSSVLRRNPASIGAAVCAAFWVCGMGISRLAGPWQFQLAGFYAQHAGICLLMPLLVATAMGFTGRTYRLRSAILISLTSVSTIFCGLIIIGIEGGLVFSRVWQSAAGELQKTDGPLYPVYVFYALTTSFFSILLILKHMGSLDAAELRRARVLVFAFLLPTISAFLEVAGFRPLGAISLVPVAMIGSAVLLAYGVLNARLLSPVILAHESLVNAMIDPILVVDGHGRVAYANPAARSLIRIPDFTLGTPLSEILPELVNPRPEALAADFVFPLGAVKYTIRSFPVDNQASRAKSPADARVYVLHDVTSMMTARGELETLVQERTVRLEEEVGRYRAAKTELEQTVSEKEVLLQELHHRVKNNLQIIISLLNLQSNRLDGTESLQSIFLSMKSRIRSISLVHERLHQTRFHDGVDFGEYIAELVRGIANLYEQVPAELDLRLPLGQFRASMDFCVDFGLVVNELVTNAFKHGLAPQGGGILRVEISLNGQNSLLRVSDSGPGFTAGNGTASRTLGMNIVQSLCQKHRVNIETILGEGGGIYLTIPLGPDGISHLSAIPR